MTVELAVVPHEQQSKSCSKCRESKHVAQFYRDADSGDGRHSWCKSCHGKKCLEWRKANREKVRAAKKRDYVANKPSYQKRARRSYERHREKIIQRASEYSRAHADKQKNSRLLRTYGITLTAVKLMREAQGGVCAICKDPSRMSRNKDLTVDHCHTTGRVRGLLCPRCNKGIGLFDDSTNILRAAISYLGVA